jgi:flagellar motor switch protein FliG
MAISSFRKAAVVLKSLPDEQAVQLLGQLPMAESAAVRDEMVGIGLLDRRQQEAALREFASAADSRKHFDFLFGLTPPELLSLLADEHPQTIALVLSHLPPYQAAEALGEMTPEQQASIIRRIATMERPEPEIFRDVEDAIQRRLAGPVHVETADGMTSVVKLLSAMPPAGERQLLADLAQSDPVLLNDIRLAMFGADVASCGADAPLS